jgi:rhomboid protease GluP
MEAEERPKRYLPWSTYGLLGITILIFLLEAYLAQTNGSDLLLIYGAKINELILAGQVWRLVTPLFLHPILIVLAFNMYSLYAIGPSIERTFGHERFLYLYFLSGISGYVVSFYMTDLPVAGAATALFGILAAHTVFRFRNRQFFDHPVRSLLTNIAINLILNLAIAIFLKIDVWAIVGGLLGGVAFAWSGGPILALARQPDGTFVVFDANLPKTARWVAAAQMGVLVILVVIRMARG